MSKEQNIFKFFNKKVVENVKSNPYVETAKVKRKLPNKVEIQALCYPWLCHCGGAELFEFQF